MRVGSGSFVGTNNAQNDPKSPQTTIRLKHQDKLRVVLLIQLPHYSATIVSYFAEPIDASIFHPF